MNNDFDYKQLGERWFAGDGPALAKEVVARLAGGHGLTDLPLNTVAGRVDLRGLMLPSPHIVGQRSYTFKLPNGLEIDKSWAVLDGLIELKEVTLEGLNLAYAYLPHLRLIKCHIQDCIFDAANCADWRMWGCSVVDSSFKGSDLTELNVGAHYQGEPNRLSGDDFSHANLAGSGLWGVAAVTDCDFSFATLTGINFFQASLIGCRFAGSLREIIFDGRILRPEQKSEPNPMRDIDMTRVTSFENVDFRGVRFDDVALPHIPGIVVVRSGPWIERALDSIANRSDLPARIVKGRLSNMIKFNLPHESDCFINLARMDEGRILMEELLSVYVPAPNET